MVERGRMPDAAWRNVRVGGPGGTAAGSCMTTLREQLCDPLLEGAIPRSVLATIIVPLVDATRAVVGALTFYQRAKKLEKGEGKSKGKSGCAVSPNNGIPRRGWAIEGERLEAAIQQFDAVRPAARTASRIFQATPLSVRPRPTRANHAPHRLTSPDVSRPTSPYG